MKRKRSHPVRCLSSWQTGDCNNNNIFTHSAINFGFLFRRSHHHCRSQNHYLLPTPPSSAFTASENGNLQEAVQPDCRDLFSLIKDFPKHKLTRSLSLASTPVTEAAVTTPPLDVPQRRSASVTLSFSCCSTGESAESKDKPLPIERGKKVCISCKTKKTPYWREGWNRGVLLCNACGIRYQKYKKYCFTCFSIVRKDERGRLHCPECQKIL